MLFFSQKSIHYGAWWRRRTAGAAGCCSEQARWVLLSYLFGHRSNSNQERICVLGFSADRVWLVSRF